jgi:hypothetical protein
MKGYRKAQKEDVRCEQCRFSYVPPFGRLRCSFYFDTVPRGGLSFTSAVGKNMTCSNADRKAEGRQE